MKLYHGNGRSAGQIYCNSILAKLAQLWAVFEAELVSQWSNWTIGLLKVGGLKMDLSQIICESERS